jgi:hypothetical protein
LFWGGGSIWRASIFPIRIFIKSSSSCDITPFSQFKPTVVSSPFPLVVATIRSLTVKVSLLGGGTGINSKYKSVSVYIFINILQYLQVCVWSILKLVNSILFFLHISGRALLMLSGYLITQWGWCSCSADPMCC